MVDKPTVDNQKKTKKRPDTSRHYQFNTHDVKIFVGQNVPKVAHLVWQLERGEEKQGLHFQGYVRFESPVSWKTAVERLQIDGAKCHVDIIPGGASAKERREQENKKNYARKEETRVEGPWELGEDINQGARNDVLALVAAVKEGKSDYELLEALPKEFAMFPRAIDRIRAAVAEERSLEFQHIKTTILIGPTGMGKSKSALYTEDGKRRRNVYRLTSPGRSSQGGWNPVWWDGYRNQDTIVLDDFAGWIDIASLLTLTDGHQARLGIKGTHTYSLLRTIIITSNLQVREWWPKVHPEHKKAFARRFPNIIGGDNVEWTDKEDEPAKGMTMGGKKV